MKIKPPKKPRRPSAKFLARKAQREEAAQRSIPIEGSVRIYLDDERMPPEGWTLVRTPGEFNELVDLLEPGRISALSLDWYLGSGVANGEEVVEGLLKVMEEQPGKFSALEIVHLHSSDLEKAVEMARRIATPSREGWKGLRRYGVNVGKTF